MKKPVGILTVKVIKAIKLRKKDFIGSSDPYVKLKLTEDKLASKKTTVKYKSLNPEWNEEFHMVVKDPGAQALDIVVYDWEQVYTVHALPPFPRYVICVVHMACHNFIKGMDAVNK